MPEPVGETVPIPEPAGIPLLGHVRALEPSFPLGSMLALAKTHGIYSFKAIRCIDFPN